MANLEIENNYTGKIIAGVDEVGRGPLAGPVIAGAVILDQNCLIDGICDSKKLSKKKLEYFYDHITKNHQWSIGIIEPEEIDRINILEATKKACKIAVDSLKLLPDIVLVDGNMKFSDSSYVSIIKGDDKSLSIAAASIVAKVTRDRIMNVLAEGFPVYKWHTNVGYGTKDHIDAMISHGATPHHRRSFKVKGFEYEK